MSRSTTGYNWRNTLSDFATTAGVLAGFAITLMTLVLTTDAAARPLYLGLRWGDVAVCLSGLSSVAFVGTSEFLLKAKEFNLYDVPEAYLKELEGLKDWEKIQADSVDKSRAHRLYAQRSYNVAIILLFGSLFFVIGPYDLIVAAIVGGVGVGFELFQVFR
jgi:hypothetical protein